MKYDAIVVAGGKGNRANLGYNKAFFVMPNGRTVLENSCHLFVEDEDCQKVIVVCNEELPFNNEKIVVVKGGKERKDSVQNGLDKVDSEYVFIHDAARPNLHKEMLDELKKEVIKGSVILARKASDTIKLVNNLMIEKTIDRDLIYMAETPQCFKSDLIKTCYKKCEGINFTDDASLVESLGYEVKIVTDKYDNKKLTFKEDFQ